MFQRCLDDFARTFPALFNILVLDNGAFQTAKALRWPPHVAAVPLPPYSQPFQHGHRCARSLAVETCLPL